jgi:hypothetical protein
MADFDILAPVEIPDGEAFTLRDDGEFRAVAERKVHVFRGHVCATESRGREISPLELVVEATGGFVPVWQPNCTLKWRFQERSLLRYRYPDRVKDAVRDRLSAAIRAWGTAAPVNFMEDQDLWDFEIAVRDANDCSPMGCTLASAFFPDGGQHEFVIYPLMFTQSAEEQLETLAHELGHVFGLRHFFAVQQERDWPSELFGAQNEISIMNYGDKSELTPTDIADLARFYELIWSGQLTSLNRTPIRLMKPFSSGRA